MATDTICDVCGTSLHFHESAHPIWCGPIKELRKQLAEVQKNYEALKKEHDELRKHHNELARNAGPAISASVRY